MNAAEIDIVSSPLFPLASRAIRRATMEAEKLGLVCVPATYPLVVAEGYGGPSVTLGMQVPRDQGPLVITQIVPPQFSTHIGQYFHPRVGSEWLTDGALLARDALTIPRDYVGRLLSSPICVGGGQDFAIVWSDDENDYEPGQGCQVNGLSVRAIARDRRRLCDAPVDLADLWLQSVRMGGSFWGMTIVANTVGNTPGTVTSDVVVECVVIAEKATALEGEVHATDIEIKAAPYTVTPGAGGPLMGEILSPDEVVVMPGLRWPLSGNTDVNVTLTYGDPGEFIPVRTTLLGRRGGISGGCW